LNSVNNKDQALNARFKELKIEKLIDFSCQQYQTKIRNAIANNMNQREIGDAFQGLQQMMQVAQLSGNTNAVVKITQFADSQISLINQVSPQLGTYLKEFLYGRQIQEEEPAEAA
jgi:hypothetical protein